MAFWWMQKVKLKLNKQILIISIEWNHFDAFNFLSLFFFISVGSLTLSYLTHHSNFVYFIFFFFMCNGLKEIKIGFYCFVMHSFFLLFLKYSEARSSWNRWLISVLYDNNSNNNSSNIKKTRTFMYTFTVSIVLNCVVFILCAYYTLYIWTGPFPSCCIIL